jgi:hypothetical protein
LTPLAQEEEKNGGSSLEEEDSSFNKRFQSLILNSNNQVEEKDGIQIEDLNALEQLSLENNNPEFEKELAAKENDTDRCTYMFSFRE